MRWRRRSSRACRLTVRSSSSPSSLSASDGAGVPGFCGGVGKSILPDRGFALLDVSVVDVDFSEEAGASVLQPANTARLSTRVSVFNIVGWLQQEPGPDASAVIHGNRAPPGC